MQLASNACAKMSQSIEEKKHTIKEIHNKMADKEHNMCTTIWVSLHEGTQIYHYKIT